MLDNHEFVFPAIMEQVQVQGHPKVIETASTTIVDFLKETGLIDIYVESICNRVLVVLRSERIHGRIVGSLFRIVSSFSQFDQFHLDLFEACKPAINWKEDSNEKKECKDELINMMGFAGLSIIKPLVNKNDVRTT